MREVIPQPGYTEADTTDLLATGQFVTADCFTVMPKVGDFLRYTTAQQDMSVVSNGGTDRHIYTARTLLIKGLLVKASVGVDVDEQDVTLDYFDNDLAYQNQMSWPQALLRGRLDGARIRRDRYVASAWGQPWIGGSQMFSGLVSSITEAGRTSAKMKVKSDLILLDVQMPRDLWEANCKNTLGDPGCGVDLPSLGVVGSVGVGSTRSYLVWSGVSSDYALGKIQIANSDSTTRVRTVSRVDGSGLYLSYPLDFDPDPALSFTAFPGCNRTKDRCPFFHGSDWPTRFKGFPFIPVAETALG